MPDETLTDIMSELVKDEDNLEPEYDEIEKVLLKIIQLEKYHLYGTETSSTKKRRDEIFKALDKEFSED